MIYGLSDETILITVLEDFIADWLYDIMKWDD